jgi:sugar phosphate isomerase/epimerase
MPVLPRWGRVVAYALATLVGITRVVYGAHLPLDVVGGACLGIAVGCVVDFAQVFDVLDETGATPFVATEVFNPTMIAELGADRAARAMRDAARSVLA